MSRIKVEELKQQHPRLEPVLSTWTVVLVEDDLDNLQLVLLIMRYFGATVLTADSGKSALELIRTIKPNFVISDLSMPDVDGWELLRQLQADEETRHIPVIALTAHAMAGDRERVLEAGFAAYFSKPLTPDMFVVSLLHMFDPEASNAASSIAAEAAPVVELKLVGETSAIPVGVFGQAVVSANGHGAHDSLS